MSYALYVYGIDVLSTGIWKLLRQFYPMCNLLTVDMWKMYTTRGFEDTKTRWYFTEFAQNVDTGSLENSNKVQQWDGMLLGSV